MTSPCPGLEYLRNFDYCFISINFVSDLFPMKKFLLLAALLPLLLLSYCKKSTEDKPVEVYDNYQPTGGGSIWTYGEFPGGTLYSVTCTGRDSTFNLMKYKEMISTKYGLSWFRKTMGFYYHLIDDGGKKHEYLYLMDNPATGANWQVVDTLGGFPTRHQYIIQGTGQQIMIYGNIYPHVNSVLENTFVDFGTGSDSLVTSYTYFYANNVGLVYIDQGKNSKIYLASCNLH